MAAIQIKGINDYLLFICNDEVCDDEIFDSIKAVISSPSFKQKEFYPKAYFDFGKREIDYLLFVKLMTILDQCQSVIFCGFLAPAKKKKSLVHSSQTIRNGEVIYKKEDCIFEGKINPGGKLVVYGNLYFLGSCHGIIEIVGKNVTCSISSMHHATLQMNHLRLEDVSIDEMTVFYIEDGIIKTRQEEKIYG